VNDLATGRAGRLITGAVVAGRVRRRDTQIDLVGPDSLRIGRGAVDETGAYAGDHGGRALVVTDPGVRAAGLVAPVTDSLAAAGVAHETFDGVERDPAVADAVACAERARAVGADCLVGVGGGSAMDVAKVAAVLVTGDGPVEALVGRDNVDGPGLPTVLLPTTAGTGSEVSPAAVLVDDDGEKAGVVDPHLFASAAVVDPDLSTTLPPDLTRATGLDAFAHAVGSYVSLDANPLADALCVEAMALIETHLRAATVHGADAPAAREEMATAATMAMLGRVNGGKAAIHSVAYGVQATCDVPHAEAVAMVLPEVLAYNLPAAVDRLARLGTRLYEAEGTPRDRAERFVAGVRTLRGDLGLDRSLREVGAEEGDLPELAERATRSERHLDPNPRPLDAADAEGILREVW
jgi:alcohol dehydrogenase class IV